MEVPQGEEKGAWHMEAMKEGYNTTAAAKHYVHAARHAAMKERKKGLAIQLGFAPL